MLTQSTFIDLSHTLTEASPVWPDSLPFKTQCIKDYTDGCRVVNYQQAAGIGTHIDSPNHFISGGRTIEQLALSELIAPACVIDIQKPVAQNSDHALNINDILKWEDQYGVIAKGVIVLVATGWSKYWYDTEKYQNMDAQGVMHFPGISTEAAELLIKRGINGIGIDTLSIDPGNNEAFQSHHIFLSNDKFQIENLNHLERLPATGAWVFALPVKLGNVPEAGARVIAILNA